MKETVKLLKKVMKEYYEEEKQSNRKPSRMDINWKS